MKIAKAIITILLGTLSLAGCSFLDTNKQDMTSANEMVITGEKEGLGYYEAYSPEQFNELWGVEKLLLFFHADWCPTCRRLEANIKRDLSILNGHTLLEVNYDLEKDLKKKYEVLTQSTVIFIDANGSVFDQQINPSLTMIENFFKL